MVRAGSLLGQEPLRPQGISIFDAKAETLATQPTWREPFKHGLRCFVLAETIYEWKVLGPKEKPPFAFTVGQNTTFTFAELRDTWHVKKTRQKAPELYRQ